MHPNALLELAAELLREVFRFQQPADAVVSTFFRDHRSLGPRDRQTLAETTYGVLRQRLLFEHLALSGADADVRERRLAIVGWQGSEAGLQAALSPAEQQWLEQIAAIDRSALAPPLRHNLPEWLADALQSSLGDDFWPLVQSINVAAPLDLRVNTLKIKREAAIAELANEGITAAATPYSPFGLRVEGKPSLHRSAIFTRGDVEVQDEGSQLLALLVDPRRGEMVVDFCAGAGGKTLALGVAMRNTGRLYAFDTSGHRLAALKPRLERSGLSNVHPLQIAHERDVRINRLAGKVDRVLVDAPCSGLGTLRRNPDLKWRQTPALVQGLRTRQIAILNSAARLLKPGGRLVYATCSLLEAENESVAHQFSTEHSARFKAVPAIMALAHSRIDGAQNLVDGEFLHLWPHRHGTDGFFAAAWQHT